jgi:hypothetical protein
LRVVSGGVTTLIAIGRDEYEPDPKRHGRYAHSVAEGRGPLDGPSAALFAVLNNVEEARQNGNVYVVPDPGTTGEDVTTDGTRVLKVVTHRGPETDTFLFEYDQDIAAVTPPP